MANQIKEPTPPIVPTPAPIERTEQMVTVKILRARWNDKGERIDEGTEIELPVTAAIWAIYEGQVAPVGPSPFKKD